MQTELINQVLELTNAERAKAGLSPLKLNSQLVDAAQDHSSDMAYDDFFNHTGVDGSNPSDRVQDTGYQYSTVGENIAAGQRTAAEVVEAWMNSPGHRANILNARYTEIGIGYEFLENDTGSVRYKHYWTQVFGTPLNHNGGQASNSITPAPEISDPTPVDDTNSAQDPAPPEELNNSHYNFGDPTQPIDSENIDLTGRNDDSVLIGDDDALITLNRPRKIIIDSSQQHSTIKDNFTDIFSDSFLGHGTDFSQNDQVFDALDDAVNIYINTYLEKFQENIFSKIPNLYI